jgi:hypothetical protein
VIQLPLIGLAARTIALQSLIVCPKGVLSSRKLYGIISIITQERQSQPLPAIQLQAMFLRLGTGRAILNKDIRHRIDDDFDAARAMGTAKENRAVAV